VVVDDDDDEEEYDESISDESMPSIDVMYGMAGARKAA
jgi:hypothetical protein